MTFVGTQGWLVLTTDKRIRYRPLERASVRENKVGVFCFTSNMGADKMVTALAVAIPQMRRIVVRQSPPFIATIAESGTVNLCDTFNVRPAFKP